LFVELLNQKKRFIHPAIPAAAAVASRSGLDCHTEWLFAAAMTWPVTSAAISVYGETWGVFFSVD
jgi:hypothetical protein